MIKIFAERGKQIRGVNVSFRVREGNDEGADRGRVTRGLGQLENDGKSSKRNLSLIFFQLSI